MRKTFPSMLVAVLVAATILCLSCAAGGADPVGTAQSAAASAPSDTPPAIPPVLDETYVESAVVTRVDIEGGFWGLVTAPDKHRLDPMKPIPPVFQKDGLRVKVWYIPRKDLASAHMWGLVIDLRRIEKTE